MIANVAKSQNLKKKKEKKKERPMKGIYKIFFFFFFKDFSCTVESVFYWEFLFVAKVAMIIIKRCWKSGNHAEEDLAKSGYNRYQVQIFDHSSIILATH